MILILTRASCALRATGEIKAVRICFIPDSRSGVDGKRIK